MEHVRRILFRPDGLGDADWARLGEVISAAVEWQTRLAAESQYILRFRGGLNESRDKSAYSVEHDPATPMSLAAFFHAAQPPHPPAELIETTVALLDALQAAHASGTNWSKAHGGLCPGVLLRGSPDPSLRVTDFGFAPAICSVLGEEAYVNLAVGPPAVGATAERIRHAGFDPNEVSGVWEILPRTEPGRDDRICGFIDPEKYGTGNLRAFEPPSDVIAAGILMHLLAERRHPYLFADPEGHWSVEMSAFMAQGFYNGARRADLRDSSDPLVRTWCTLIASTLERLPRDRPPASQIATRLRSGKSDGAEFGGNEFRGADRVNARGKTISGPMQTELGRDDSGFEKPSQREGNGNSSRRRRAIIGAIAAGTVALVTLIIWLVPNGGECTNADVTALEARLGPLAQRLKKPACADIQTISGRLRNLVTDCKNLQTRCASHTDLERDIRSLCARAMDHQSDAQKIENQCAAWDGVSQKLDALVERANNPTLEDIPELETELQAATDELDRFINRFPKTIADLVPKIDRAGAKIEDMKKLLTDVLKPLSTVLPHALGTMSADALPDCAAVSEQTETCERMAAKLRELSEKLPVSAITLSRAALNRLDTCKGRSEQLSQLAGLCKEFSNLSAQLDSIEQRLGQPTHEDLAKLHKEQSVPTLLALVEALRPQLPSGATALASALESRTETLRSLAAKMTAYGRCFGIYDLPLPEAIATLESGKAAFATSAVADLLDALKDIQGRVESAQARLPSEWRIAQSVLQKLIAELKGVKSDISTWFDGKAELERLSRRRRESLQLELASAINWVRLKGNPPRDFIDHIRQTDNVTAARRLIDKVDLDFPPFRKGSPLLTTLTSEELSSVMSLLSWTNGTLTIASHPIGTDTPALSKRIVPLAGGGYHSLGIKSDGSIVAWGAGGPELLFPRSGAVDIFYQPLQRSPHDFAQSIVPLENTDFIGVGAGVFHSLGLRTDGSIAAWGAGESVRGDEPHFGQSMVPVPNIDFVAVAAGAFHSLGLKTDGTIVPWGRIGPAFLPAANSGFIAVAAGHDHSLALQADSGIVAWGANDFGQIDVPAPNTGFVSFAAGAWHNLALRADGSIVAWGYNDDSQCNVPAPNKNFIAIAAGWYHSLALRADGAVVAWGRNVEDQCYVPEPNEAWITFPRLPTVSSHKGDPTERAPDKKRYVQAFFPLTFVPRLGAAQDSFWITLSEITVRQYRAVMGELPKGSGHIYEHMIDADNHPITFVSPDEAAAFCRKLWDQPEFGGKIIVRLPTLDEWLFARDCGRKTVADGHPALCRWDRAGNPAIDLTKVNLPSNELWNLRLLLTAPGHEDGAALHSAIGQNPPNRWLLYDMIGNVREWVTVPGSQDFAAVGGSFRERDFEEVDRIEQRPWEDVGFRIVVVPAPE